MRRIATQPRTHADLNAGQAFVQDRMDSKKKGFKSAKNWAPQAGKPGDAFKGNVFAESGQVSRTFSRGNLNKARQNPGSLRQMHVRAKKALRPPGIKSVHTVTKPSLLGRLVRGVARRKLRIA
jgi:hypothetical protein